MRIEPYRASFFSAALLSLVGSTVFTAACKAPPIAAINVQSPSVAVGAVVPLLGDSSMDPNGQTLTYAWQMDVLPAGSHAAIVAEDQVHAWFMPDVAGPYTVQLVVADSNGDSSPATTQITAGPCGSNPPTVSAISANPAAPGVGGPVMLSAMVMDADNQSPCNVNKQLSYNWTFVSLPAGARANLNSATLLSPSFTPQVPGTYEVGLVVTDSMGLQSVQATQSLTVSATPVCGMNSPVAKLNTATAANCNIGGGSTCTVTATISTPTSAPPNYLIKAIPNNPGWNGFDLQLDGSTSFDPDNQAPCNLSDTLSYNWQVIAAPLAGSWSWQSQGGGGNGGGISGTQSTLINPTLQLRSAGIYQVQLIVSDGNLSSSPINIQIQTQ